MIGRLDSIVQEDAGTAVTGDVPAGETTLLVEDTLDFVDSAALTVGAAKYVYSITSDTELEVTPGLLADVGEGASVEPLDSKGRTLAAWYAYVFLDDDDKPARVLIPSRDVPYFTTEFAVGDLVEVELVDRRWRVVTRPTQQPVVDMTGVFASNSPDNDTRVTVTIALNPFGLGQDWALLEFWADDPTLAAGKIWARYNPDDGYASLTMASPALAGEEAAAAQLILSKNADGSQLATLIAQQIDLVANSYHFGSVDGSSVDFHAVGSSQFQLFSDMFAPTGWLNFSLGGVRTVIGAWNADGTPRTLRLKGASVEFEDGTVGVTTLASLLDRIADLEARVSDLEGP